MRDVFIHPTALSESDQIGSGTRVWGFSHILKGAEIGTNCNICDHCFIESNTIIGNGVTIKNGVSVWAGVTLEDFVFVGPHAAFTNDRFPRSSRNPELNRNENDHSWLEKTYLKKGATLGAHATILCNVTIGQYAMVGAGSLVTKDVPDFALVTGNPAHVIGFVCMCGSRLPQTDSPQCPTCKRNYVDDPQQGLQLNPSNSSAT